MAKNYTIVVTPVAELRNSKCPYKNANIGSKFGGQLSWWKGKDLVREHTFKPGENVKETLANLFAHVVGTRAPVWVFLKLNSLCVIVKMYRSCDMDTIKLCSTSSSTVRILLDFEKVDNRERSFVELNDVDESLGHDSGIFTDEGESFGEILPLKRLAAMTLNDDDDSISTLQDIQPLPPRPGQNPSRPPRGGFSSLFDELDDPLSAGAKSGTPSIASAPRDRRRGRRIVSETPTSSVLRVSKLSEQPRDGRGRRTVSETPTLSVLRISPVDGQPDMSNKSNMRVARSGARPARNAPIADYRDDTQVRLRHDLSNLRLVDDTQEERSQLLFRRPVVNAPVVAEQPIAAPREISGLRLVAEPAAVPNNVYLVRVTGLKGEFIVINPEGFVQLVAKVHENPLYRRLATHQGRTLCISSVMLRTSRYSQKVISSEEVWQFVQTDVIEARVVGGKKVIEVIAYAE